MSAFAGLSSRHNESGSSVRGRPRMCKKGNARVRTALYMAALSAVRKDNPFRDLYRRLVATGRAPKAALGAVMRKMLVVMRAMLIGDSDYDPTKARGGKTCGKPGPELATAREPVNFSVVARKCLT
jgi:transposase